MKTIGNHKTPKAGEFTVSYEEVPRVDDHQTTIFVYHITAPDGRVFQIKLVAFKGFIPEVAGARDLMESKGLNSLTALLDTMDENGYIPLGSSPSTFEGFMLTPQDPAENP